MTNSSREPMEERKQDLKDACDQLAANNVEGLHDLRNLQIMAYTMYQHEALRLSRILGESHPRVQGIGDRLRNNMNLVRSLDVELEIAGIRVPEVPEDGVLVHGRITDKANRGISGLIVFAENEKGKPLRALVSAKTDASGYYAIQINDTILQKLKETGIFLAVGTSLAKVFHREKEPLELKPNSQLIVNITLDPDGLHSTSQTGSSSPRKTFSKKDQKADRTKEGR